MKDDDTLEDGSGHENKQLDNASFSKKGEPFSSSSDSEGYTGVAYQGSVYHVGVNRLGHHFCHPRFLRIRGTHVEMFKQDADSGVKPIRQGVAGQFLKVEDLGRRRIDDKDLYVLKISNSLDDTTKGEIACRTASDARKWRDAFLQAKDEAWTHFHKGSGHNLVDDTDEFNLSGHRPRLRRYAKGLTKLITIGSEHWFGKGGKSSQGLGADIYAQKQDNDTVDEHKWRCVCTVNGIRILEDASACMAEKNVILKSVGVIEASPSAIFEMLIDIQNPYRKEWDILTGDLKVVEVVNGHCDIVYGTFDPKYLRRWNSKRDFVFSRVWRHDPDNTYSILQSSTSHKDFPKKWGSGRITLNPTFWEIKPLPFNRPGSSRSQVTQTMEIRSTGWGRWKRKDYAKLDKTIPYVILCQIAGLRDYFASDPLADANISTTTIAKSAEVSGSLVEATEVADATHEEFYDAIAAEVPEEEEEDDEDSDEEEPKSNKKPIRHRFRNTALALIRLTSRARAEAKELVSSSDPVEMTLSRFKGSLPLAVGSKDSSCWMDPGGKEFMVRGKTYSRDYLKVSGGDPLLTLLAVDWLQAETRIDFVATNKNHLVQSEAGKQLPFILVINLQVPAKPNYSLVFYFGAERPIRKGSLLDRFVNGNDAYRNSRFKLIPRIVEGYWFVKRAVGTKACLLGKAVTCSYIRQDNFLEIDVDIGSSSVARSIINLVLGHVTSLVVDMAVLIEAREESELPEYILGTTRVIRVELASAIPYK